MTIETKAELKLAVELATQLFWAIAIKHDIAFMDLTHIAGLDLRQLSHWRQYGVSHAPVNADECLVKLMKHLGVI